MEDKRRFQRPYPEAFRREAIEFVRSGGGSIKQIASDLGICHETLRHWLKQGDIDSGSKEGLTTDERSELRELRRRVRTLEQEREVLKKPRSSSRGRASPGEVLLLHRGGEDPLSDLAHV